MAKVVETVERDGHQIAIYESGAEYDLTDKKLVKGPTGSMITAENATVYIRKRQEKQAALLRSAIRREHNSKMEPIANSSAAVFAESGALLYSEIVLNDEAYPRDRLEAWEKLGKYAQVLPSDIRQSGSADGDTAARIAEANAEGIKALERIYHDIMEAKQRQSADIVDGSTIPAQLRATNGAENT